MENSFELLEKDNEATPGIKAQARRQKMQSKTPINKVEKEWYEKEGKYIRMKSRMTNGNVYSKHVCKATKENIDKLKSQGIEVKAV